MKFFLNLDFKKILTERERAVLKSILKGEDNDSEEDLCALYSNWKLFIILKYLYLPRSTSWSTMIQLNIARERSYH